MSLIDDQKMKVSNSLFVEGDIGEQIVKLLIAYGLYYESHNQKHSFISYFDHSSEKNKLGETTNSKITEIFKCCDELKPTTKKDDQAESFEHKNIESYFMICTSKL